MSHSPETPRDLRKKLRRAENSRDSWKDKQAGKQYELKIVKNKLRSALESRDKCKSAVKKIEQQKNEMSKQLIEQNQQLEEYRAQADRFANENEELKKKNS